MKVSFTLSGQPVAWRRVGRNKSGSAYDTQRQEKEVIGWALKYQAKDICFKQVSLKLNITFYLQIPKTKSKLESGLENQPHYSPPDLSNLVKFLEDVLQEINIIKNDCLISEIYAKKLWSVNPRTVFTLEEINCTTQSSPSRDSIEHS